MAQKKIIKTMNIHDTYYCRNERKGIEDIK